MREDFLEELYVDSTFEHEDERRTVVRSSARRRSDHVVIAEVERSFAGQIAEGELSVYEGIVRDELRAVLRLCA
jgi:hypothetical protein